MKKWVISQIIRFIICLVIGAFTGLWAEWLWLKQFSSSGMLSGMLIASILMWLIKTMRAFRFAQWIANGATGERGRWTRETGWARAADWIERRIRSSVRRADNEIRLHQQILSALQKLPVGIMLLDHQGRITWINDTAVDHFNLDREKDLLQHLGNLVRHPDLLDLLNHHRFEKTLYLSAVPAKGRLAIQIAPYDNILDKNRKYIMLLSRDISDLERTDQMRRDFVANISHEMRTPLTILSGFIETMQTVPLQKEDQDQYLDRMSRQMLRMRNLIDDLLFLAKLEASPVPPLDQWIDIHAILEQVQQNAEALSGNRHIITFPEQASAHIAGIETELISALSNLVSNAIRYTPEGGHIQITWQTDEQGRAVLSVKDDGPGIKAEDIPRLTERFYRADKSRSRETGGTGLGLAIVKHIQTRHNGSLLIDSTPGHGAEFRLIYPAKRIRSP